MDGSLGSHSELNLKYTVRPSVSLVPGEYMLVMRVFYQDQLYEYSSTVINRKVAVHLAGSAFSPLGILTMLMLAAGACFVVYHVTNFVVNRFFYGPVKPHQPQFDLLVYLKEIFRGKRE